MSATAPTAEPEAIRISRASMLLAYVTGAYGFSYSVMVAFLIPLRAMELDTPIEMIGLIVGAGAAVPALLSVPSGELADRLGPRRTYILSTFVSGIVTLVGALTQSYWVLFAVQLVSGLARSTAWLASQTYLTSVGRPEERATITGRMSFATNAGMIVAPLVIGASSDLVGFQWSFVTLSLMSLLFCLMGTRLPEVRVPRTTAKRGGSAGFGLALGLLRLRGMQVVLQLTFVRIWSAIFWMSFYPVLMVQQGFGASAIGTLLAVYAGVSTVVTLGAGRVAARLGNAMACAIALGLGAIGVALSPHLLTYPLVFLPAALVGIGQGLSLPLLVATVSEEAPPDQRGVALGLRMSVNQGASTVAPIIAGGVAAALGIGLSFAFNGALSLLLLVFAAWLYRGAKRR